MKPKVSRWNSPADGKTRIVFDLPDELAALFQRVARAKRYKTMGAFYRDALVSSLDVMEEQ